MQGHDELFEDKYICNVTTHMVRHLVKRGMNIELMDHLEVSESYKLISR